MEKFKLVIKGKCIDDNINANVTIKGDVNTCCNILTYTLIKYIIDNNSVSEKQFITNMRDAYRKINEDLKKEGK